MKLTRAVMAVGLAVMLGCAALVTGPTPASAVATISLFDGSNTVSVFDGGPGDLCAAAGCVTFSGPLGVWNINVTTGISDSPFPFMDLNSIDRSTGAGTLKILLGDTDFTRGAGPHQVALGSAIGGTTAGSVTWHSGLNDSNINPVTSCCDQTGSLHGPLGPGAFSQTNQDTYTADGTFALALEVNITHTGAGVTSFDYEGKVPGPATLLLLGFGLVAAGALRRRAA
jgi:hypothetical protein